MPSCANATSRVTARSTRAAPRQGGSPRATGSTAGSTCRRCRFAEWSPLSSSAPSASHSSPLCSRRPATTRASRPRSAPIWSSSSWSRPSVVCGLLLLAALAGFLLSNYYFAPPVHTFTIGNARDILALTMFLVTAGVVSVLVDLAARRTAAAVRARTDARTSPGSRAASSHPREIPSLRSSMSCGSRSISIRQRSCARRGNPAKHEDRRRPPGPIGRRSRRRERTHRSTPRTRRSSCRSPTARCFCCADPASPPRTATCWLPSPRSSPPLSRATASTPRRPRRAPWHGRTGSARRCSPR